jgi:hypothetical protein
MTKITSILVQAQWLFKIKIYKEIIILKVNKIKYKQIRISKIQKIILKYNTHIFKKNKNIKSIKRKKSKNLSQVINFSRI